MTIYEIMDFFESSGSDISRLKVIVYILEHTDPRSYIFSGSFDDIARKTGVSFSTVSKTMQACRQAGLIKPISHASWHIEDNVFEENPDEPCIAIRNYME